MKKISLVCCIILCLLLAGCGQTLPEKTVDGTPWEESWVIMGSYVGVETPQNWEVQRNEDVLAAEGMYYAVWTTGNAHTYTNDTGDEVTTYDAEIHMVVTESDRLEDAAATASELEALTLERYPNATSYTEEYAGQTFQIWTYSAGASATGIRDACAIRLDVTTQENFSLSPSQVLSEFLQQLHYAK